MFTRTPWRTLTQCGMNTEESYFNIRNSIPGCELVSASSPFTVEKKLSLGFTLYHLNYPSDLSGDLVHHGWISIGQVWSSKKKCVAVS